MATEATEAAGDGDGGGGIGKKLALGAVVVLAIVLVARALRGGDEADEADEDEGLDVGATADETTDTTDIIDESGGATADEADEGLPVDTDVQGRFDEIDIVDAVYVLVAGLKAAREEYQQRTDEGGA